MAEKEKRSFLLGAEGGHVLLKKPDKRPHGEGITLNGTGLVTVWGPRSITKYRPDPKYVDPKKIKIENGGQDKKFSFFRPKTSPNTKPIPLVETIENREVILTPAQVKELYYTLWEEGLVTQTDTMEFLAKLNRYGPKGAPHPEGIPETEPDAEGDEEEDDEPDGTS